MFASTRNAILILAVFGLVFSIACSSSGPKAQSAPPIPTEPAPTPVPQPSVSEEVISDHPSQPVVSEQPTIEELPQDLVDVLCGAKRPIVGRATH